ncbi:MAG: DNA-directed RNA polymerase subunit delta [Acholeplasmataceae bacterium]|jgi:DNA-directed RNA polymerase subunit delta|nr:DNA-directed RNA polymerase subunit delta [Acholeplasmataceae bacterium]
MAQYDQSKPMVEIAEEFIRQNGKQNIYTLIESVAQIKGFSAEDEEKVALLYVDMTLSGNFVYCGNDEWDIKENNLELWDKDGSYFNKDEDYEDDDDDDDIKLEDYFLLEDEEAELDDDEEDEEDKKEKDEDEEEIIIDDDVPVYSTDDDDVEVDLDFDDDDYHDIMDDYEDMYED